MKNWKRLVLLGIAGVFSAMLVTGCSGDKKEDKTVLRFGVTNFASSLEPTENYFAWVVMRYGIGETLSRFNEKMEVAPWLAESWQVDDRKVVWKIMINDKAIFSNGKKVTAEKVKKSIERVFAKSKRAETFFRFTNITANGQELTITTDKPYPNMMGLLADPLFVIVDVDSEKERNFATEGPIGTGPYEVRSFVKEKAVMKKNTHYWNGTVPYETVEIPSIDDPNTRALALQSGEIDLAVNIAAGDMSLFQDTTKYHVDKIASLRTILGRLNMNSGHILSDSKVRAALISLTNRKEYNETVLKGTFITGKAPIPPSLNYGFDELVDPNQFNQERAKQLLDEAGWKDTDGDGIREKDGKPLALDIIVYNSRAELPIYAEAIQGDAQKIGMSIKIKTVDYNLLDKIGINGEYDILLSNNTTAPTGDPEMYLSWYWKTNNNGDNEQNGSGYSNPVYDAKLAEMGKTFDPAKRRQLGIELQQILLNDGAALFLGYPETNMISSTKIQGAIMHPADYYWLTNLIKPVN